MTKTRVWHWWQPFEVYVGALVNVLSGMASGSGTTKKNRSQDMSFETMASETDARFTRLSFEILWLLILPHLKYGVTTSLA